MAYDVKKIGFTKYNICYEDVKILSKLLLSCFKLRRGIKGKILWSYSEQGWPSKNKSSGKREPHSS